MDRLKKVFANELLVIINLLVIAILFSCKSVPSNKGLYRKTKKVYPVYNAYDFFNDAGFNYIDSSKKKILSIKFKDVSNKEGLIIRYPNNYVFLKKTNCIGVGPCFSAKLANGPPCCELKWLTDTLLVNPQNKNEILITKEYLQGFVVHSLIKNGEKNEYKVNEFFVSKTNIRNQFANNFSVRKWLETTDSSKAKFKFGDCILHHKNGLITGFSQLHYNFYEVWKYAQGYSKISEGFQKDYIGKPLSQIIFLILAND